jgi:putative ABC transport system ATP-binding protein
MGAVLESRGLAKTYGSGALAEPVLADVTVSLEAGQTCVLLGPSGSGKTTLLSLWGCLLTPTAGELAIRGEPVRHGDRGRLTEARRRHVGFVFQHAQLLPFLSLEENVRLVGHNGGLREPELTERVNALMAGLGLEGVRGKRPGQASGGQQQRAAVARALVHRPAVLLADEPTAALDWQHGEAVVRLLNEQARRQGAVLVTVTHDTRLVPLFDRAFTLMSGRLVEQGPCASG